MQYYLHTFAFIRDHLASWVPFFVLTFFLDVLSFGFLSFHILREAKSAYLEKRTPDMQAVLYEIPLQADFYAWFWMLGLQVILRVLGALFFFPLYITCGLLSKHVLLLGVVGYLILFVLFLLFCTLQSILLHWYQLLYIDGYFSPKDCLLVSWRYTKKMSRPVSLFCLIENVIHVPLYFSCAVPVAITRPLIMIARVMYYETEREHILLLAKEEGFSVQ